METKRPSRPSACGKRANLVSTARLQPAPFPDEGGSPGAPGSRSLLQRAAEVAIERMNEMNFTQAERTRPKQVAARLYASTAPGPGPCPGSKVRTCFEDAHRFSKVRILENPDDFFEDAQAFPRCARKTAHLRGTLRRERLWWPVSWRLWPTSLRLGSSFIPDMGSGFKATLPPSSFPQALLRLPNSLTMAV
jgi:hypothetical protein